MIQSISLLFLHWTIFVPKIQHIQCFPLSLVESLNSTEAIMGQ